MIFGIHFFEDSVLIYFKLGAQLIIIEVTSKVMITTKNDDDNLHHLISFRYVRELPYRTKFRRTKLTNFGGQCRKFCPAKLNFVNKYSDKTGENLGQCRIFCPAKNFVRRIFCPAKNFVRRKFCPAKFCPIRHARKSPLTYESKF